MFNKVLGLCALGLANTVAHAVTFNELQGWWCAEPTYDNESSKVCLHFLTDKDQPSVRLSLLGIGGYEVPIGTVRISGDELATAPFAFPLHYDTARKTLRGTLLEAAVPVYNIPAEFQRVAPVTKPVPQTWDLPRPKIKWSFDVKNAVWAALEYDADSKLLFVASDAGTVHALDAKGMQRWAFETGKPIRARPAVSGGALYVASDSGFLYKLELRTGRELWRARIDMGSPSRLPASDEKSRWDRYGASAVADATRVFVASRDKHLYALDARSGKELWRLAASDIMTATPALYRDSVLFASYDGRVAAVAAQDGTQRWTYDAKLAVAGDITVVGDRAYFGSRTYDLIALGADTGAEIWKRYYWFSWIESPPVVRDGVVYTGSSDGIGVFAFDAASGKRRWKTTVPGYAWARTAVTDRLVVAGTVGVGKFPGPRAGALVAMERSTGALRWAYLDPPAMKTVEPGFEWGFAAGPVAVADTVFAADLAGLVYAFDSTT